MKPCILLDMDEVLVDFVGAACRVHGWAREEVEHRRKATNAWCITTLMGINPDEFWEPINAAGEKFWVEIEPLPWLTNLIAVVENIVRNNWFVITDPNYKLALHAPTGKLRLLHALLGSGFERIIMTPGKYLCANDHTTLIDDRETSVDNFITAGGNGILFPTVSNSERHYSQDPIRWVKFMLDQPKRRGNYSANIV